jgi:hypothetical protein
MAVPRRPPAQSLQDNQSHQSNFSGQPNSTFTNMAGPHQHPDSPGDQAWLESITVKAFPE